MTLGSELQPGTLVNHRYFIRGVLGRGGFGRTYLATDQWRFNEFCVLKEFAPSNHGDEEVTQKLRELFQREASILYQLDHPQIPKFFAVFEENTRLFIAQEYIDGRTYWSLLRERHQKNLSFTATEMVQWLYSLLQVLEYLHRQNIVHRDISPDNVMLAKDKNLPVLIDFGAVKQAATRFYLANGNDPNGSIQASVSVGKSGYAPSEQLRMGQCSPRSDLYALAVTAVVLLTGRSPTQLINSKTLEWKWQHEVDLDPDLIRVLSQMMADKPQDRYASATDVLKELREIKAKADQEVAQAVSLDSRSLDLTAEQSQSHASASPASITHLAQLQTVPMPLNLENEKGETYQTKLALSAENSPQAMTQPPLPLPLKNAFPRQGRIGEKNRSNSKDNTFKHRTGKQREQTASDDTTSPGLMTTLKSNLRLVQPKVRILVGKRRQQAISLSKGVLVALLLSLLPIGGGVLGVRSPHIASICGVLQNCAGEQRAQERYQFALTQAERAKSLIEQAKTLADLQQGREQLLAAVTQLETYSQNDKVEPFPQQALSSYQGLLQALNTQLERENRAVQLLNRAEAEASRAAEQTRIATTLVGFQAAQQEWRKALATLQAVPPRTFVGPQVLARTQEYKARLGAVDLRVAGLDPGTLAQLQELTPTAPATIIPAPFPPAPIALLPVPGIEPQSATPSTNQQQMTQQPSAQPEGVASTNHVGIQIPTLSPSTPPSRPARPNPVALSTSQPTPTPNAVTPPPAAPVPNEQVTISPLLAPIPVRPPVVRSTPQPRPTPIARSMPQPVERSVTATAVSPSIPTPIARSTPQPVERQTTSTAASATPAPVPIARSTPQPVEQPTISPAAPLTPISPLSAPVTPQSTQSNELTELTELTDELTDQSAQSIDRPTRPTATPAAPAHTPISRSTPRPVERPAPSTAAPVSLPSSTEHSPLQPVEHSAASTAAPTPAPSPNAPTAPQSVDRSAEHPTRSTAAPTPTPITRSTPRVNRPAPSMVIPTPVSSPSPRRLPQPGDRPTAAAATPASGLTPIPRNTPQSANPAAPTTAAPSTNSSAAPSNADPTASAPVSVATRPRAAGEIILSAGQTLDNVSIGLNSARINATGTMEAELVVENHSDRRFGFVPLFAEVKNAAGQTIQSRIVVTDAEDAVVEPGETLRGKVYLFDHPWNQAGAQNLALEIQEGTSGNRNFRIQF